MNVRTRVTLVATAVSVASWGANVPPASAQSDPLPQLEALAPHDVLVDNVLGVSSVASAPNGDLFLTNANQGTLLRVADGTRETLLGGLTAPRAAVWEAPGQLLFVSETGRGRARGALQRFDLASRSLTTVTDRIDRPVALAAATDGTVFILTPDSLLRWRATVGLDVFATGFRETGGVIVRSDGTALVAAQGYRNRGRTLTGSIFAVSPGGNVTVHFGGSLIGPGPLALDALGSLYAVAQSVTSGEDFPGAIFKIFESGSVAEFASGLAVPRGVAFSVVRDLLVADGAAGVVVRFRAPSPPEPAIASGSATNLNPFDVTGTAEVGAVVVAAGTTAIAPVAADGTFTLSVPLNENQLNPVILHTIGAAGGGLPSLPAALDIIHDNLLPQVLATVSPPPNATGWNDTPVMVSFQCTDALSGIQSCSSPVALATEGSAGVLGTAVDRAGNIATISVIVNIDLTNPTIDADLLPPPNAAGWNNTPVFLRWNCADALSGIATCPSAHTVDDDGAHHFIGRAADRAGNEFVVGVDVNIDTVPPNVTATASPSPNADGWNNTPVVVTFQCGDALSGIAQCPSSRTVTTEGEDQQISGTATDRAGNVGTGSIDVSIDLSPPVLSITSPANNSVVRASAVTVEGVVTDALSGVARLTCNGSSGSVSGSTFSCTAGLLQAATVIVVSAFDRAGNSATQQITVLNPNQPPTANPGGPYTARVGESIQFTGLGSSDPDGDALSYTWVFGDSSGAIGPSPSHTYAAAGTYLVSLTVTDGFGGIDTASTTATISDGNQNHPPTADPGGPYTGRVGESIHFTGLGSSDPDNDALSYTWVFGDGSGGSGATPTHIYSAAGTYTVSLTVTDGFGGVDTASTTATISDDSSGGGFGDPHMLTFDGLAYDFQGVGEFVMAKSLDDGLAIQMRTSPWLGSTVASIIDAVAMNVDGDRVGIYVTRDPSLYVNGTEIPSPSGTIALPSGGQIISESGVHTIVWPDSSRVRVESGGSYLNVVVRLPRARSNRIEGLLGDFDDEEENDLASRNGAVLSLRASFDQFYGEFGDSWRLTQNESLFDYLDGESTETFTDRAFPARWFSSLSLPESVRNQAEQICLGAGVSDLVLLDACVMDVGVTGDPDFAESSATQSAPSTSVSLLPARLVYVESGGRITGEGELYSKRTSNTSGSRWLVIPDEPADLRPAISNARAGRYVQAMAGGVAEPLTGAGVEYVVNVSLPGTYRLFVRWDGDPSAPSDSNAIYADVVELKDGPGGVIADWYGLGDVVDGSFASRPWDGGGGFEGTIGSSDDGLMTWTIATPGVYTLRFTYAKPGAALDAFVLQLVDLPEPAGEGPAVSSLGSGGKIVAATDEWTLSDSGFAVAPSTVTFVRNLASYFTGGRPGNFLAFSSNFGLIQPALAAAMTAAGHSWTVDTGGGELTLAQVQQYDAVFLAGTPVDNDVLIAYVNSGGNVYLAGGTGAVGSAAAEAAQWATFLNAFGLGFSTDGYNSLGDVTPITSSHPIFQNVSGLYHVGGSSVVRLDASDGQTILVQAFDGTGLYGVLRGDR